MTNYPQPPYGPQPPGPGPYGPQPPYGTQPYNAAPAQPPGIIRLTVQGNSLKGWLSPTIRIDGYPAHSGYGIIDIPVVPGHHIISGEYHWLWTYGQAQLNMQVGPGKVVPVFYNGPWINFSKGSIGHEPQQAPGTGCLIATLVVMGVLVLIAVLLAIFGGTT